MAGSVNSSGWKAIQHLWVNVAGTWTKVRKRFQNINGVWTQTHGDNDFVAYSLGLLQNQVAGAKQGAWANGVQVAPGARSYTLTTFDKFGNVSFNRTYDIYGEAADGAPSSTPYGSAQFAADINALATHTIFLITTYDEPLAGAHPDSTYPVFSNFVNAMLALGATSGVFQSSSFANRGAYMLLGTTGVGVAFEAYRGTLSNNIGTSGTDSGCLDGAIQISFNVINGNVTNVTRQL